FTIFSLVSPNLWSASSTRSFNVAICCLYLSWQMNHIIPAIGTASTATVVTNGRGEFHATSQKPGSPVMTCPSPEFLRQRAVQILSVALEFDCHLPPTRKAR